MGTYSSLFGSHIAVVYSPWHFQTGQFLWYVLCQGRIQKQIANSLRDPSGLTLFTFLIGVNSQRIKSQSLLAAKAYLSLIELNVLEDAKIYQQYSKQNNGIWEFLLYTDKNLVWKDL